MADRLKLLYEIGLQGLVARDPRGGQAEDYGKRLSGREPKDDVRGDRG